MYEHNWRRIEFTQITLVRWWFSVFFFSVEEGFKTGLKRCVCAVWEHFPPLRSGVQMSQTKTNFWSSLTFFFFPARLRSHIKHSNPPSSTLLNSWSLSELKVYVLLHRRRSSFHYLRIHKTLFLGVVIKSWRRHDGERVDCSHPAAAAAVCFQEAVYFQLAKHLL